MNQSSYIGRFAPSPSGPLHFGSLVTALGSFLQARKHNGKWLLRIEDIDPPREVAGATDQIMGCLEAHKLYWDDKVVFQSDRSDFYDQKICQLQEQGVVFNCSCSRAKLSSLTADQLCDCAKQHLCPKAAAIRFNHSSPQKQFTDGLLGHVNFDKSDLAAQFCIKRKDGLYAYQLAVVADDIDQGITEVARGADLLGATAYQLALYRAFGHRPPKFLHFPLVVSEPGKKLSKQNHAPPIKHETAQENIVAALSFLGLSVPSELSHEAIENILDWAVGEWDVSTLVAVRERILDRIGGPYSI